MVLIAPAPFRGHGRGGKNESVELLELASLYRRLRKLVMIFILLNNLDGATRDIRSSNYAPRFLRQAECIVLSPPVSQLMALQAKQFQQLPPLLGRPPNLSQELPLSSGHESVRGVFRCVAKLPAVQPPSGGAQPEVSASNGPPRQDSNATAPNQVAPNHPQVVILPPIQQESRDDEEEPPPPTAPPSPPVSELEMDDEAGDAAEDEPPADESADGASLEAPMATQLDYEQTRPGSLLAESAAKLAVNSSSSRWQRLRKSSKLLSGLRQRDHESQLGGHLNRRRAKRQVASTDKSGQPQLTEALAQLITQTLVNANRQRQQQRAFAQQLGLLTGQSVLGADLSNVGGTVSPVTDAIDSLAPIGQRLVTILLRQAVEDLPIRMANIGQMFANLIGVVTVNNPMILGSPALARVRQFLALSNTNLNLNDSLGSPQISQTARATSALLLGVLNNLTRTIANQPGANLDAFQSSPATGADLSSRQSQRVPTVASASNQSSEATKPVPPASIPSSSTVRSDDQLESFISKLTALTLGQVRQDTGGTLEVLNLEGASNETRRDSKIGSNQKRSSQIGQLSESKVKRRTKRSLGTMLMFGPFSKFYVAMTLHRMMRYQSSVLSQALMSELLRRYVIPGVTSAFSLPKGGQSALVTAQMIGQAKQALAKVASSGIVASPSSVRTAAIEPSSDLQQTDQIRLLNSNSSPTSTLAALPNSTGNRLDLLGEASGKQQQFFADCQFVQQLSNGQTVPRGEPIMVDSAHFDQRFLNQLMESTASGLLASAINNPAISFDQEAGSISFNLPLSQTSVTIPTQPGSILASLRGTNSSGRPVSSELLTRLLKSNLELNDAELGSPIRDVHPLHRPDDTHAMDSNHYFRALDSHYPHKPQHGPVPRHARFHPNGAAQASRLNSYSWRRPPPLSPLSFGASPPELTWHQSGSVEGFEHPHQLDLLAQNNNEAVSELLKQATPSQLIELMNKINLKLSLNHTNPFVDYEHEHGGAVQFEPGGDRQSLRQDELDNYNKPSNKHNALLAQLIKINEKLTQQQRPIEKTRSKHGGASYSADELADRLLNKTLATWMQSIVEDSIDAGKLAGHASDSLANSMGELLKEMNLASGIPKGRRSNESVEQKEASENAEDKRAPFHMMEASNNVSGLIHRLTSLTTRDGGADVNAEGQLGQLPGSQSASLRSDSLAGSEKRADPKTLVPLKQVNPADEDERSQFGLRNRTNPGYNGDLSDRKAQADSNFAPSHSRTIVSTAGRSPLIEGDVAVASDQTKASNQRARNSEQQLTPTVKRPTNDPTNLSSTSTPTPQQQPLNNLAMALNVMNMVLLNQRLANATSKNTQLLLEAELKSNNPSATRGQRQPANHLKRSRKLIKPKQGATGGREAQTSGKLAADNGGAVARHPNSTATTLGSRRDSNHRTSLNSIKLHSGLMQAKDGSDGREPNKKLLKYHYKPLVAANSAASSNGQLSNLGKISEDRSKFNSSGEDESENDHATRWNDVLQHLNLSSAAA